MEIDIFGEIEKASADTTTIKVEIVAPVQKFSDDAVYVPLSYQIYKLANGRKEVIDTYYCDRVKGIVPTGKAKKKADLMKQAFSKETFYVEAEYSLTYLGKTVKETEVIYQTK
jgi:hypothetical protein